MPAQTLSSITKNYDFILVGAGSASCLIASRLSQQLPDHQIIVLEAGEHLRNDHRVQTPGLSATLQSNPTYDWQYSAGPEPGLNGKRVKHPRGKLVGGTSAINSHSVVFPNHEWHDRLAEELLSEAGRAEWSSQGMKDCYRRWQAGDTAPLVSDDLDRVQTSFPRSMDVLQSEWIKAFEELGHATTATAFAKSSPGAVTTTNAIDSSIGERSHAGVAFLEPALRRGNVTLKTGVKVDSIAFEEVVTADGKLNARGVRYTYHGEEHVIRGRQVILCAGVFESPAILERSGIGSTKILTAANIPILYELPGVGENLQDHLNCGLSFETEDSILTRDEAIRDPDQSKAALLEYEKSRTGRMSEGGAYSFAFTPLQMLESPTETQELTEAVKVWVEGESNASLRTQYHIIQKTIESPKEASATTFMLQAQRHRDTDTLPRNTPPYVDGNYITVVAMIFTTQTSKGLRTAIPIVGGNFSGPRLTGEILDLGADWGLTDPQTGLFTADTRYNLQTDDGANIYIQTSGTRQLDGKLHLRLVLETGDKKYYWLNYVTAVGLLQRVAEYDNGTYTLRIDAWNMAGEWTNTTFVNGTTY
ncbi:hypothetical protein EKO04_008104 [Ascochyta lentis]|uniref:Glucose-methanol-choline oxidoreductase N-terminal domain-containing protein n=1 Tax=Ascochyta lentis TaxID=205686 RepID=A0A8H7J150_9PLEO|nr:hypothetical protein EKO04_008104 [Ascochyta lentis]